MGETGQQLDVEFSWREIGLGASGPDKACEVVSTQVSMDIGTIQVLTHGGDVVPISTPGP